MDDVSTNLTAAVLATEEKEFELKKQANVNVLLSLHWTSIAMTRVAPLQSNLQCPLLLIARVYSTWTQLTL